MAEREQDPRIQALYDAGKKVYSFSRLTSVEQCLYGAWLTYIKHEKGSDNIYSALGGRVHDTLEKITHGEATEADLWPAVTDELAELDLRGIEFPKSRNGSDKIRERYIKNMEIFCRNYRNPKGIFKTEELLILDMPESNRAMIGYADLIRYNKDGTVSLYDYKTSSMYVGDSLTQHGNQLLIYAAALEQAGYKVRDVAWIFLKYSRIQYETTVAHKIKKCEKTSENVKIADSIEKLVDSRMRYAGYDEIEREVAIAKFKESNNINDLPHDIAVQFKVSPLVKKYDISEERMADCISFIHKQADRFESMTEDEAPEAIAITERNSFYCSQLCDHRNICPYLKVYQENRRYGVSNDEFF